MLACEELGLSKGISSSIFREILKLSRGCVHKASDLSQDAAEAVIRMAARYRVEGGDSIPEDTAKELTPGEVLRRAGVSDAFLYVSVRNKVIDACRSKRYNFSYGNRYQQIGMTETQDREDSTGDSDCGESIPSAQYTVYDAMGSVTRYETKWKSGSVSLSVPSCEDRVIDALTVEQLLSEVGGRARELIELCVISGIPQETVSALYNTSRTTVGKSVRKAISELRVRHGIGLEDREGEEDEIRGKGAEIRREGTLLQDPGS